MTITSSPIYANGVREGVVRYWNFEVDLENAQWRGHYGIMGGKDAVSGWRKSKPTNTGKANERNASEQAHAEAIAEEQKKLAREYRQLIDDLGDIPPDPMLAQKWQDLKKPLQFNVGREPWGQPKLDGIRMLSSKKHGGTSREFQPFYTVAHLIEGIGEMWLKYPDLILDGELYNHALKADFNKISSLVRKQKPTEADIAAVRQLLEYHVYDCPSHPGNFSERAGFLEEVFHEFALDVVAPLVRVPSWKLNGLTDVDDRFGWCVENGYEGLMVRTDDPYELGTRSWSLMKHKGERRSAEFPISKIIEGNGNWAGCAKAVEVILPGDKRGPKGERQKAGIKGTQEFCRELLTRDPRPDITTIEYFGETPDGMLRFPVAVDWHTGARKD